MSSVLADSLLRQQQRCVICASLILKLQIRFYRVSPNMAKYYSFPNSVQIIFLVSWTDIPRNYFVPIWYNDKKTFERFKTFKVTYCEDIVDLYCFGMSDHIVTFSPELLGISVIEPVLMMSILACVICPTCGSSTILNYSGTNCLLVKW